ncbi:hypothetical protein [Paenibacillus catalpae]|uniref:hypothetical protein n=1 Tax=Paenibacillus catalpae TaxID=1045775 RepID=UPI000B8A01DB|nr:hypothetical protein [Paenibacillus catalpae]
MQRLQQTGKLHDISLYSGVGPDEKPNMVADSKQLNELVEPYQADGLRHRYRLFEGEGHVSVVHPMISDMLRFILRS